MKKDESFSFLSAHFPALLLLKPICNEAFFTVSIQCSSFLSIGKILLQVCWQPSAKATVQAKPIHRHYLEPAHRTYLQVNFNTLYPNRFFSAYLSNRQEDRKAQADRGSYNF
jgi:hypothetical protein